MLIKNTNKYFSVDTFKIIKIEKIFTNDIIQLMGDIMEKIILIINIIISFDQILQFFMYSIDFNSIIN